MQEVCLNFDPVKSFTGLYTWHGICYENYCVTYCRKPVTGLVWSGVPSEQFFRMNIKVLQNLSLKERRNAKILFYNPWGGDYGQPVPAADRLDNPMKELVMKAGWILAEPGMRGTNCFTGTPGKADFHHFGKLPAPLADLKAGIRYLRFGDNERTVPGDKDRIFIAGVSSGGCAASILGVSGDAAMFLPYLKEIGAAETSDAVFGAVPSCPVMNRGNLDAALAWERWYGQDMADADPVNRGLAEAYTEYIDRLGVRAERDVLSHPEETIDEEKASAGKDALSPCTEIHRGDLLTHENLQAYCYEYVKDAGKKFFGHFGSEEEIRKYLSEKKPADPMYGTPETDRNWIRPVFAGQRTSGRQKGYLQIGSEGESCSPCPIENKTVTDFDGTCEDFWKYTVGEERYDRKNRVNMQCDRAISGPDDIFEKNGAVNIRAGYGFGAAWGEPSTPSFGKPEEIGAIFTEFGQKWISEHRGIMISEEYRSLTEMQRNSVDPMFFLSGKAGSVRIAERWFLRTGTVDQVTPHPNFILFGTALMNLGKDVDLAFVWDETHGLTSELPEFLEFSRRAETLKEGEKS